MSVNRAGMMAPAPGTGKRRCRDLCQDPRFQHPSSEARVYEKRGEMAKRPTVRKQARKRVTKAVRKSPRQAARKSSRPVAASGDALVGRIKGADRRTIGHVALEVGRAGAARVKRMIYPPGFRWSVDMKPVVGTDLCMHAHVGFLARGRLHVEYADGCRLEAKAPQIIAIDPGHDGWVVGNEPVVLIEFDFEGNTIERLGMPTAHRHD
jgi:hypothetical protein